MPRIVDHEQRRAEIIQAVWSLIGDHGIEAVTMRRVAERAGISVGRIQHYFASKEDLVHAACTAMIGGAMQAYEAGAAGRRPAERLQALLVQPFARTDDFRRGARVWLTFVAKSVDDPWIAEEVRSAKAGAEAAIAALLAEGGLDPRAARGLLALSDGLAERTLTGSLTADEATEVVDTAVRALPRASGT